jgi:hypothetical protein
MDGYFSITRAIFGFYAPDFVRMARGSRIEFQALREAPRDLAGYFRGRF